MSSKLDIVKLIESYGIEVVMKGSIPFCLCPFHKDSNPSLALYKDTNSFYCYACNTGGPIEKLIAKIEGISTKDAFKKLYGENYEFNRLNIDDDELDLDKQYMLDRIAVKIRKVAAHSPTLIKDIPDIVSNVLFNGIDLLKFNDIIKTLDNYDKKCYNDLAKEIK